ncbi:hypothetical protein C7M84_017037 [Penaeus vannamei]|uniref:Uncharacterized protein n=1 Tax=Penaeus vannamei TaxID=6689 RepID=A0A3R7QEP7_PENVA|nr:hypothetical protein C7M84_017037 [Penaeus vannamei]
MCGRCFVGDISSSWSAGPLWSLLPSPSPGPLPPLWSPTPSPSPRPLPPPLPYSLPSPDPRPPPFRCGCSSSDPLHHPPPPLPFFSSLSSLYSLSPHLCFYLPSTFLSPSPGRDDEGHGASVAVLVSMRRWQKDESCVQYGAKLGPFPVRLGIWQDFHSSMTQTPPFLPPPPVCPLLTPLSTHVQRWWTDTTPHLRPSAHHPRQPDTLSLHSLRPTSTYDLFGPIFSYPQTQSCLTLYASHASSCSIDDRLILPLQTTSYHADLTLSCHMQSRWTCHSFFFSLPLTHSSFPPSHSSCPHFPPSLLLVLSSAIPALASLSPTSLLSLSHRSSLLRSLALPLLNLPSLPIPPSYFFSPPVASLPPPSPSTASSA